MSGDTTMFRYDLILFDVGGTLIGFHDPAPYREFLAEAGLPASEEDARRFHRRLTAIIMAERDGAQGLGAEGGDLRAWWHGNFAKAWPERPDLAEEMLRWLYAGLLDRTHADSIPALEALRAMGLPLGILSNFDTHLEEMLRRLGLRDYFDFVIASAAVGLAKPDRRAFDLAVARAARPRQRILYVGDHIGDDIEGARRAGLDAVLIDRANRQSDALCPRIGSLLELADYVCAPPGPVQAVILDMDGVVLDSRLVAGIGPLLHDLEGRGYRLGLVTGSARSVADESLAATGVVGLFDAVISGDEVARGKPDPEPYREAAARLGLHPAACLVVESAPPGIESAKAAGLGCVALETIVPAERLAAADMVFRDAWALRSWLLAVGLGDKVDGLQAGRR